METPQRPFGYLIKHIDRGIEESFGRLLAAEHLTRRGWQVLHTIASGPVTMAALDDRLAPFHTAADPTVQPHVEQLAARDWATVDGDAWTLTEPGARCHERVAALVQTSRLHIIEGLSPDDYRSLMSTLERVAANVDTLLGIEQ